MNVTIWNYKGGVGKSTICLILAEIAAQKGLNTTVVDLDEQQNLASMLSLKPDNGINVRKSIPDSFTDLVIIDTHPVQNDIVLHALSVADIVLIPILCDYPSLVNLSSAFDFVYSSGLGRGQAALVKNRMTNLSAMLEIESIIDTNHFPIAGRLLQCNSLLRNIASGFSWDRHMRENQRNPFLNLYDNVWNAHRNIQRGNFQHIWG